MDYYKRANELKEDTIEIRRYLHKNAEVGSDLPNTVEYVMKQLKEYGIQPQLCGHGVTATIGKGKPVILLRADMDALPITELSGEEFTCTSGNMHACGHDIHTAMLLTAARMLKEDEDHLHGTVKLMFQSAEEIFKGANDMIEHGILDNPRPDAAMAYHMMIGKNQVGTYMYNAGGIMMNSVDEFKITIHGKGTHGAYPHQGIDPINIGVHIHLALQELISREANPQDICTLTIGKFNAGSAANIIPESAILQGTLRTNNVSTRENLLSRMKEVCHKIADTYRGTVEIEMVSTVPPLMCDPQLTLEMAEYMSQIGIEGLKGIPNSTAIASEDFAIIAEKIPTTYMILTAGFMDERGDYPLHHPKAQFDENVCVIGAACFAYCASHWLGNHKNRT